MDEFSGEMSSKAMRFTLVIGVFTALCMTALVVLSISLSLPWPYPLIGAVLAGVGITAIVQGLTAKITYDRQGLKARPLPWKHIQVSWPEVLDLFRDGRGRLCVSTSEGTARLLPFGRTAWQIAEAQAAIAVLNSARR